MRDYNIKKQLAAYKSGRTFPHRAVGRIPSVVYTVLGSVGMGGFGTAVVVLGTIEAIGGGITVLTPIIMGLALGFTGSAVMGIRGITLQKRLKRFKRYLNLLKGKQNCTVQELAAYSGYSEKYIVKDFSNMISAGMFPQAHIDEQNLLIMLNQESYNQYKRVRAESEAVKITSGTDHNNGVAYNVVEVGRAYIKQISLANRRITDLEVSTKVAHLEDVVGRIIAYINEHMEQATEVRRLMDYYLPTTIKLLKSYEEFEMQPIEGTNIKAGKTDIKNALDTINIAFEKLLNKLFENAAWDVSADISVMQTIMAEDGLTEKK